MNAASVKARLMNYAKDNGKTFQEVLTYYGLERTIYRLSISPYSQHFTLKGGVFLYAMYDRNYARATTDIDLLAEQISNSADRMKEVFRKIFLIETDDALRYDLENIDVVEIAEQREYHGLRVSAFAYLDRTRLSISVDIGFGDVVCPSRVQMDFPVLLDMEAPRIFAYSLESSIAEKLEAIISNGMFNSRYKDFYDIYVLSEKYSFDAKTLANAIAETFANRRTDLHADSDALTDTFSGDELHQNRWNAFIKRKKAMQTVSLQEVSERLRRFLLPLIEDIDTAKNANWKWTPDIAQWEHRAR